jgi:hypothetical protein
MSRYETGDWCTGSESTHHFAAAWLKASATDGMHAVATQFNANGLLALTLSGGALALLPIGIALRADSVALTRALQDRPWRMSFVWLSLLALVPLFAVASDWNRWFYILASLLTFIHFGSENSRFDRIRYPLDPDVTHPKWLVNHHVARAVREPLSRSIIVTEERNTGGTLACCQMHGTTVVTEEQVATGEQGRRLPWRQLTA